ncbi:pyrimidine reductase family protein [Virgisporangium aurantiacum]
MRADIVDRRRPSVHAIWRDRRVTKILQFERGEAPLGDDDLLAAYATDPGAPWLRVNFVTSLDGAVTATDGFSAGISDEADKRVFGLLRMTCDALMVGAGTLRHEGYGAMRLGERREDWRVAHGLPENPLLIIVSRRLDLDPASPMFTDAPVRPLIVTSSAAPVDRRQALSEVAHVLAMGDDEVDLPGALEAIHALGFPQILCEGGPHLLGSLTANDLVDELDLTLSPLLIGPGPGRITAGQAPESPRSLQLHHILTAGNLLLLRYTRPPAPS